MSERESDGMRELNSAGFTIQADSQAEIKAGGGLGSGGRSLHAFSESKAEAGSAEQDVAVSLEVSEGGGLGAVDWENESGKGRAEGVVVSELSPAAEQDVQERLEGQVGAILENVGISRGGKLSSFENMTEQESVAGNKNELSSRAASVDMQGNSSGTAGSASRGDEAVLGVAVEVEFRASQHAKPAVDEASFVNFGEGGRLDELQKLPTDLEDCAGELGEVATDEVVSVPVAEMGSSGAELQREFLSVQAPSFLDTAGGMSVAASSTASKKFGLSVAAVPFSTLATSSVEAEEVPEESLPVHASVEIASEYFSSGNLDTEEEILSEPIVIAAVETAANLKDDVCNGVSTGEGMHGGADQDLVGCLPADDKAGSTCDMASQPVATDLIPSEATQMAHDALPAWVSGSAKMEESPTVQTSASFAEGVLPESSGTFVRDAGRHPQEGAESLPACDEGEPVCGAAVSHDSVLMASDGTNGSLLELEQDAPDTNMHSENSSPAGSLVGADGVEYGLVNGVGESSEIPMVDEKIVREKKVVRDERKESQDGCDQNPAENFPTDGEAASACEEVSGKDAIRSESRADEDAAERLSSVLEMSSACEEATGEDNSVANMFLCQTILTDDGLCNKGRPARAALAGAPGLQDPKEFERGEAEIQCRLAVRVVSDGLRGLGAKIDVKQVQEVCAVEGDQKPHEQFKPDSVEEPAMCTEKALGPAIQGKHAITLCEKLPTSKKVAGSKIEKDGLSACSRKQQLISTGKQEQDMGCQVFQSVGVLMAAKEEEEASRVTKRLKLDQKLNHPPVAFGKMCTRAATKQVCKVNQLMKVVSVEPMSTVTEASSAEESVPTDVEKSNSFMKEPRQLGLLQERRKLPHTTLGRKLISTSTEKSGLTVSASTADGKSASTSPSSPAEAKSKSGKAKATKSVGNNYCDHRSNPTVDWLGSKRPRFKSLDAVVDRCVATPEHKSVGEFRPKRRKLSAIIRSKTLPTVDNGDDDRGMRKQSGPMARKKGSHSAVKSEIPQMKAVVKRVSKVEQVECTKPRTKGLAVKRKTPSDDGQIGRKPSALETSAQGTNYDHGRVDRSGMKPSKRLKGGHEYHLNKKIDNAGKSAKSVWVNVPLTSPADMKNKCSQLLSEKVRRNHNPITHPDSVEKKKGGLGGNEKVQACENDSFTVIQPNAVCEVGVTSENTDGIQRPSSTRDGSPAGSKRQCAKTPKFGGGRKKNPRQENPIHCDKEWPKRIWEKCISATVK